MLTNCKKIGLTVDPAMKPIAMRKPMTENTRFKLPMISVPVFKEAHAQQFGTFGRVTIVQKYLKLEEQKINQGPSF